jgi:3-methyladenine DNA glycosylase AlkD
MEKQREKLVRAMRAAARPARRTQGAAYLGTTSATLNVTAPQLRKLARDWVRANEELPREGVLKLCDSLFAATTHHEKAFAAIVLGYHHEARAAVSLKRIERWLGNLHGWAEVDALCQNLFQAEEMLGDWIAWKAVLTRLSRDKNINKRRAALVLLTGPLRYSDDAHLSGLAFNLIERLQDERDILITKAISWLLRALTIHHRVAVTAYVEAHETTLPRIAVRETRIKLTTGTKSGRHSKRA